MQSSLESQVVPGPGAKAMAIHCLSNCMAGRNSFSMSNLCAWHSLQLRFFSEKLALDYYYTWLRHLVALKHRLCEVHNIKDKASFNDTCESVGRHT